MKRRSLAPFGVILCFLSLNACTTAPPDSVENICKIFKQYPSWYWATQATFKKWHVPIHTQMAIVHQESHFTADAKPPREKLLWIIPWFRPTSAYGYSQAVDETWRRYKKDSKTSGSHRDEFDDAVDFIGWFATEANRRAGIKLSDAYRLYLAYHEGVGGYIKGTYQSKTWLINVAQKVARRAWIYKTQLNACRSELKSKPWYHFW